MKLVAVPILILLVATQAFSKWVLLLEFKWNRDYISKNLCINKTKPEANCGGKCQLMKRMAEEEKESAPLQTPQGKSGFQEVLFTATPANFDASFAVQSQGSPFSRLKHWKQFSPPCSVFHPPLV